MQIVDRKAQHSLGSSNYDPVSEANSRTSLTSIDIAEQNKQKTAQKYVKRYTQDEERLAGQRTRISVLKAKLSNIPIDVIYNRVTNRIKAAQINGVTNSFIPILIKQEHESFAQHGDTEVKYVTSIQGVDMEEVYVVKKMKERCDNTNFENTLKVSRKPRDTSNSNPFTPKVYDHLKNDKQRQRSQQ